MSAQLAARRRLIARYGRPMVLRRQTGVNPVAYQELPIAGYLTAFRPEQLSGGVQQGDASVAILNDELAAAGWPPPRAQNAIVIDGKTWQIVAAPPMFERAVLLGYKLWVRGGAS